MEYFKKLVTAMIIHKYNCDRCESYIDDGMYLIDRKPQSTPEVEQATRDMWPAVSHIYTDGIQFPTKDPAESSFHICKDCNDRLTKFMEPNVK